MKKYIPKTIEEIQARERVLYTRLSRLASIRGKHIHDWSYVAFGIYGRLVGEIFRELTDLDDDLMHTRHFVYIN